MKILQIHNAYQHIPIIKDCNLATSTDDLLEEAFELKAFPNPFRSATTISFSSNGVHVRLSIFNAIGSELKVLVDKTLPRGEHQVNWNSRQLPAGNYYYRLQEGVTQKTKRLIKIR